MILLYFFLGFFGLCIAFLAIDGVIRDAKEKKALSRIPQETTNAAIIKATSIITDKVCPRILANINESKLRGQTKSVTTIRFGSALDFIVSFDLRTCFCSIYPTVYDNDIALRRFLAEGHVKDKLISILYQKGYSCHINHNNDSMVMKVTVQL